MNAQLNQKVAHYVELAHAAVEDANAKLAERATKDAEFAKQAAAAAQALVENGTVDASAQMKLAEKLTDLNYVLPQLVKLAKAKPVEANAQRLGTPVPVGTGTAKQASANKSAKSQKDIDFVTQLGLPAEYA